MTWVNPTAVPGSHAGAGLGEVQTAVVLLGGWQVIGHVRGAAEVRDNAGTVLFAGTWGECKEYARRKGYLPAHMA